GLGRLALTLLDLRADDGAKLLQGALVGLPGFLFEAVADALDAVVGLSDGDGGDHEGENGGGDRLHGGSQLNDRSLSNCPHFCVAEMRTLRRAMKGGAL